MHDTPFIISGGAGKLLSSNGIGILPRGKKEAVVGADRLAAAAPR